jgi:oligoribonuclease NrnB/cAMP/cGMP phosphodiesterase (DHH superfamily)
MGYGNIILVDVSFPPKIMKDLAKLRFIWIDHHVTAIESSRKFGYDWLPGKRQEIGKAACELAWEFFFPDRPTPDIIQRISAYDVWDKDRFDWKTEVLPLQSALRVTYGVSEYYLWPEFNDLLCLGQRGLQDLLDKGMLLGKYDAIKFKSDVERFSFPITVAGKYRGVALIGTNFTSIVFDSVIQEYDVYCVANRRESKEKGVYFTLSLYAEPNRIDLNLGEYLRSKFGDNAGGHKCAAGAQIELDDFMKLILDKEI